LKSTYIAPASRRRTIHSFRRRPNWTSSSLLRDNPLGPYLSPARTEKLVETVLAIGFEQLLNLAIITSSVLAEEYLKESLHVLITNRCFLRPHLQIALKREDEP
jgi:hypothetical protein